MPLGMLGNLTCWTYPTHLPAMDRKPDSYQPISPRPSTHLDPSPHTCVAFQARLQQQAEKERRLGEQAKFERDEFERIIEAGGRPVGLGRDPAPVRCVRDVRSTVRDGVGQGLNKVYGVNAAFSSEASVPSRKRRCGGPEPPGAPKRWKRTIRRVW